jgi:hypothetical protein
MWLFDLAMALFPGNWIFPDRWFSRPWFRRLFIVLYFGSIGLLIAGLIIWLG